jgi:FSR family fosmidomycin resistance protein-like MFS transporter
MSFFMFGGELARTLGPLLITAAVSWWGIEGSWKLIPVGLVASLLLFLNLRTIDKKQIRSYNRPKRESFGNSFKGLAPLFHTILPILFFRGFSKTALSLFLPSYMTESGHSLKTAAAALALMELSGALGALAAGTVSDKIGRKTVLLAIMLVSPLFMFLFTLSTGIVSWLLLVIIGLVFFASTPVFMAMVHDIDSDRPSMANGIFMTLNFVSGSAIALLLGLVADHYSLLTAFKMSALLGLPAILPVIWMKEKKRPE